MDRFDEKVDNSIRKFKEGRMPTSELIRSLFDGTGKTMMEVLEICQRRLGSLYDEDTFFDEALPLVVAVMHKGTYMAKDGYPITKGSGADF